MSHPHTVLEAVTAFFSSSEKSLGRFKLNGLVSFLWVSQYAHIFGLKSLKGCTLKSMTFAMLLMYRQERVGKKKNLN